MARIAFVVGEDFEDSEFRKPCAALRQAGHEIDILGIEAGAHIKGKKGETETTIDKAAKDADPASYDALVIPGGYSPDHLRTNQDVVKLVTAMTKTGKVIAAVCHAPSLLIEAGVVKGKTLTSFGSIKTDLVNAGAKWVDKEVVVDGNLITSRNPHDLPAFIRAIEHALEAKQSRKAG
ncbi:MAG: type 1 glutamine amidotransferase domain-containing protein [Kofleriaceae bacterium]